MRGFSLRTLLLQLKIGLLISVLILLSGCIFYPPKGPLEIQILRLYDSPEEYQVVSFVEMYDFLDFIPLAPNDSRVFSTVKYDSSTPISFVRNISDFLLTAENHYNRSDSLYSGKLTYFIDCFPSSAPTLVAVLEVVKERHYELESENLTLRYSAPIWICHFAAFLPQNQTTVQIISSDRGLKYSGTNFSTIDLTNLSWVVPTVLEYDWSGTGEACRSFEFSELILLTSELDVIALFTISGGRIC